jgi:enolase
MSTITDIKARQILDSRGNPTVEVDIYSENHMARAAVPSGASTGIHEAVELRDGDTSVYGGKGVTQAVKNVETTLKDALIGMNPEDQTAIDAKMMEVDGSKNKGNLGANAILGISLANAKLAALETNTPLYQHFAKLGGKPAATILPVPMMNIVNGGEHSDAGLSIQEFMVIPKGAPSFSEALRYGAEIFHALKKILAKKGLTTSVGDEGGFAPHIETHKEVLETIMHAIDDAGHSGQIEIALDCAASEFYKDGMYHIEGQQLDSTGLVEFYKNLFASFPITSVEDSHAEDDFEGFQAMYEAFGNDIQLVGDDLLVTNPERVQMGIEKKLCNSVLVKVNQIGSISETIKTIQMSEAAGWTNVVSHRSGETEDTTIADLVVGLGTGQIKTGSLCRTDRVCKYNQLLRIEEELGSNAVYGK